MPGATWLVLSLVAVPAFAQQQINTNAGDPFMEEVVGPQAKPRPATQPKTVDYSTGQPRVLESPAPGPLSQPAAPVVPPKLFDCSNLGVSIDARGKLVPLLGGPQAPPAPNANLQVQWGLPAGYVPAYNPWTNRNVAIPYTLYAPNLPPGSMPLPTKTEPWAPSEGIIIDTGQPLPAKDNINPSRQ